MAKSIQDLIDLDINDVMRMNRKELSKVVSQLSSTANKRLKRLGASDIGQLSPAYKGVAESGRDKFSVKKKTTNQLRNEYKAVRRFLSRKSSTFKGWNEIRKATFERIGGDFGGDTDTEKEFWKIYRELEKGGDLPNQYGSTESQVALRRVMTDHPGGDAKDYKKILKDELDRIYESREEEELNKELADATPSSGEYNEQNDPFFTLFDDLPD